MTDDCAGRGILTVGGVDGVAISRHLWRACVRAAVADGRE
jgi:hypothetical protein